MPTTPVTSVSILALVEWFPVGDTTGIFDDALVSICYDDTGKFTVFVADDQAGLTCAMQAYYPTGVAFDGPKPVDPTPGAVSPGGQTQPPAPGGISGMPAAGSQLGILGLLAGGTSGAKAIWIPLILPSGGWIKPGAIAPLLPLYYSY